jgi:hypothetical protein
LIRKNGMRKMCSPAAAITSVRISIRGDEYPIKFRMLILIAPRHSNQMSIIKSNGIQREARKTYTKRMIGKILKNENLVTIATDPSPKCRTVDQFQ